MTQPQPQKILQLAGEGGGLCLYRTETNGAIRYSWDSTWQVPDESGDVPTKTPGWKPRVYESISEAVDAAPRYWIHLAPVFVTEDLRESLLQLVSARLANSHLLPSDIQDKLARWERACGRRPERPR